MSQQQKKEKQIKKKLPESLNSQDTPDILSEIKSGSRT
jgi:hypothetical protein